MDENQRTRNNYLYYTTISSDPLLTDLFVSNNDFIQKNEKLIVDFIKNIPNNNKIKWQIICFLKRPFEDKGLLSEISSTFAYEDVHKKINDPVVKALLPYIDGKTTIKKQLSQKESHHFSFYLIAFKESYPGLFICLYKVLFNNIIKYLDFKYLFNNFGIDSLCLLNDDPNDLYKIIQFDTSDLQKYFSCDLNYKYTDFTDHLQRRLILSHQFPDFIPSISNHHFASLLNTCIVTTTHFVDLISQLVLEDIISQEFDKLNDLLDLFPDVVSYIICNHQKLIYTDLQSALPILKFKYKPSIASKCIQLFLNDFKLINMVSFITANDITITDLSKSSLPKLLEYVLSQKEILEYSSLEYFSFTPEETTMDFDFIRCYNILSKFLMIFKLSSHNVKQSIVEIGELLNEIKNNETLNSIIIDLFSLIFLQKNEKYICTLFITKELLSLLNKFSQRLSKAYALVQKAESF